MPVWLHAGTKCGNVNKEVRLQYEQLRKKDLPDGPVFGFCGFHFHGQQVEPGTFIELSGQGSECVGRFRGITGFHDAALFVVHVPPIDGTVVPSGHGEAYALLERGIAVFVLWLRNLFFVSACHSISSFDLASSSSALSTLLLKPPRELRRDGAGAAPERLACPTVR